VAIDLLNVTAISTQVFGITGNLSDGAAAAGYSAWINSVTGENPSVLNAGERKAKLILSRNQAQKMQNWIDDQVTGSLKPSKDQPSLQIEFGPVIVPEVIKYAIILAGLGFIVGYVISKKF